MADTAKCLPFFYRCFMKNKNNIKVLLVIMMVCCMIFATSCSKNEKQSESTLPTQQPVQQTEPTSSPDIYWQPFVSQKVYDAYNENEDVAGWLTVTGCEIDNRVFQSTDNDYYLRLNENGEYDVWGCYFLDYINVNDGYTLPDKVSIIYGHALDDNPNSEKFSKLKRFKNSEFALQNSTITFNLLYDTTEWEIFAVCDIPITIDYIDPNPDEEKYTDTLEHMQKNSYVDFGVDITTDDQILVLSTCTSNENIRFVVAAKIIE